MTVALVAKVGAETVTVGGSGASFCFQFDNSAAFDFSDYSTQSATSIKLNYDYRTDFE